MSPRAKIVGGNLLLVALVATVVYFASGSGTSSGELLVVGLLVLLFTVVQSVILLVVGLILRRRERKLNIYERRAPDEDLLDQPTPVAGGAQARGDAYVLASGVVLLLGASICFGSLR